MKQIQRIMVLLKKIVIPLILVLTPCLFFFKRPLSQFQKIDSYTEITLESIEYPGTLVLFDIDDTLLWLPWPEFTLPLRLQVLWNFPEFINASRWEQVYSKIWQEAYFQLIEPIVVQLIKNLKSRDCIVLGLTSMESGPYGVIPNMPEWRYQTLVDFGIEFTQKFGNHTFKNFLTYRQHYPMLWKGILCTNQQSKGKVLEAFLTQFDMHPRKIISFDDQPEALESIREACTKLQIPVILYQYTGAEKLEKWDTSHMVNVINSTRANNNCVNY